MELAASNFEIFYSQKLVTCKILPELIKIYVKIPLKTVGSNWKIIEFRPIPFAWQQSICRIFDRSDGVIAAVSENHLVPLTGQEKSFV